MIAISTNMSKEFLMRMHNPPHPGLVLREYLGSLAVTTAAAHLRTTRVTLSRVLNGKAGISASMAIRLAAALGTTPELWMNMQSQYDLWRARQVRQPAVRRLVHAASSGD
jgi:addiction module HigA family antidote